MQVSERPSCLHWCGVSHPSHRNRFDICGRGPRRHEDLLTIALRKETEAVGVQEASVSRDYYRS